MERQTDQMKVVTRFAPSPTGFLHIGGVRTALFNWLFAQKNGGIYKLRVEDTDLKRSTQESIKKIYSGLGWLGLKGNDEPILQSRNIPRHIEVVKKLLSEGKAYKCYCTQEELVKMRSSSRAAGRTRLYDRRWRDKEPDTEIEENITPSIRIKMPIEGKTMISDLIQGDVTVTNDNLDDFVILRPDGTPTYMLAVVVDDHDMDITHVIRGDDHLNNAFRQYHLFDACGWDIPYFAHMPLIHGNDGAKLSKRHGALGIDFYQDLGILPQAMQNYLLRLGWSHGDDEIISMEQAVSWFDLESVGRAPSRFDMEKLNNLNAYYIKENTDEFLVDLIIPRIECLLSKTLNNYMKKRLLLGMPSLKQRAKNINILAESALFYCQELPLGFNDKAAKFVNKGTINNVKSLGKLLEKLDIWEISELETSTKEFAISNEIKLGEIAQPLRVALTGSSVSPGIFDIMHALGRDETLSRINDFGNQ